MKLLLLDKNEVYIKNLLKTTIAERHAEINSHDLLMLETLEQLEKGQRILYKSELGYWHEYIVQEVVKRHEVGLEYEIYCEASYYEMRGDYIEDKRPTNVTPTGALNIALEPTRWQAGNVDDLGLKSTTFYQISSKDAIMNICEIWGAEFSPRIEVENNRITGRFIDLKAQIGYDTGKRFTYTRNMEAITKTVSKDDVITALYGYGKGEEIGDGYGRRVRFGDINDGKDYVESLTAKDIWGRLNPDGTRSHVFGKEIFDQVEEVQELKDLTTAKLEELSTPLISYSASVLDLKAAGFDSEGVDLGDTCLVIDKEFDPELRIKARVVEMIDDLINKRKYITLGNFVPLITDSMTRQEAFISDFRSRASVWDRATSFNPDGSLQSSFIEGAIDVLKNKLISTHSNWYTDDNGNLVFDSADGTSSMMLSGAGFMIADTRLPNGDWDYRTFGTGHGFTADLIIAGALMGGNVAWNLEDGTLLIGDSPDDYQLYYDGYTLFIDGVISPESVQIGNESIADILARLGQQISDIQQGGGNLLKNTNLGTYADPSTTFWSDGINWNAHEMRFQTWWDFEAANINWYQYERNLK